MPPPSSGSPVEHPWPSVSPDALPLALAEVDPDGALIHVNRAFGELMGAPAADLLGRAYWECLHPDERADESASFRQLRESTTAGTTSIERRLARSDGPATWVELQRDVVVGGDGNVRSAMLVLHDVTQRRVEEAVWRDAADRYRLALRHSPVVVWTQDVDLRFTWVSDAYVPFHPASLIGRTDWDVLPHDAAASTTRVKRLAMERLRPEREEVTFVQDGRQYSYDLTVEPLLDQQGQVLGVCCIALDVTERLRTRAALVRSEQRFREAFEQAAVGMAEVSIEGRFLLVNERLCQILGYRRERLLQFRFQDITWPEDLRPDLEHAQRLVDGEVPTYVLEKRYVRGDGTPVWTTLTASLVRTATGAPYYFIGVVQDITDRKRVEAEAEAARALAEDANRQKDEFIATLSHELRTPLNAMLGWTNLLKSGLLPPEQHARAIETIERNARAQARLLADILDVSRIVAGKITLEPRPTTLATVVERVIEDMRITLLEKRLDLRLAQPASDTTVLGEPSRLQQVVWNLLSNAVKFTPAEGRIDVSLTTDEGSVTLAVRDTGIGISPEFLPHVFERFRQADGSSSRRHTGLGLGLAIAKHLVLLHSGTIAAQSEGENQGATFTVVLPLLARPSTPHAPEPSAVPAVDIAGTRVLVIDDHDDARDLARVVLERHGVVVDTAASAQEAVRRYQQRGCHLALVDISMPVEDGFSCLERLQALAATGGTPLRAIALTAHTGDAFTQRALAAGFAAVVGKPISPDQLVALVAENAAGGARPGSAACAPDSRAR